MNRDDTERLHTSVLVAPASEKRRLRKERRKAVQQVQAQKRAAEKEAAVAKFEAEKAERRTMTYLPKAG